MKKSNSAALRRGLMILSLITTLFGWSQKADDPKNEFSISAQIRPRAEYRNGAYKPLQTNDAPAILVHNRTRLTLDYSHSDILKMHIALQNINVWGQANQVQITDPSGGMSVYEAYGDIKLSGKFRTRIGRQAIVLDDERIFGGLDWHPAGRSHDALSLFYKKDKVELNSYFALNQNYKSPGYNVNNPSGQFFSTADAQPYHHMQLLYAKFGVGEKSYISALFNNLGLRNDQLVNGAVVEGKVYNLQTMGANWFGSYGKWKSQASAYYQTGKGLNGKSRSAYMLAASAGYQLAKPLAVIVGVDYLSGDSSNAKGMETKAFDPLYGTHHKFYGFMDYYYVGNAHGNVGLMDSYINLAYKAGTKTSMGVNTHFFSAAGEVLNTGGARLAKGLGSEIDLHFSHAIQPFIVLSGGYSTYFTSSTLKTLKSTPNARGWQDWLWLSININPKIFTAKF